MQTRIVVAVIAVMLATVSQSSAQTGRMLGAGMAVAGAAMLLIDPTQPVQPTQPGLASHDTLQEMAIGDLGALGPAGARALRRAIGAPVLICEPFCIGAIDEALFGAFIAGGATGIVATTGAIDDAGWRVYQGEFRPFIPYEERSAGLKYGGAALAIGGALLAVFWSDPPDALADVSVARTPGGARLSKTFGF